jgi:hypothetical protein
VRLRRGDARGLGVARAAADLERAPVEVRRDVREADAGAGAGDLFTHGGNSDDSGRVCTDAKN